MRKSGLERLYKKMIANSPLSLSVVVTNKETNEIKELTSKRQAA
jgi:hypothetical protein